MPTPISGPYIARSISISGQSGLLTFLGLTGTNRAKTIRDAADTLLELGGSYTPTGTYTSLTMVTPVLGTPTSGVLTNCTGTADGLTAGDVTRNHAVYAAASPPTVDVGLFTIKKTGVDLKTNATTDIFTVPASRTFVCTSLYGVITASSVPAAVAFVWKVIESGAGASMTPATAIPSTSPTVGRYIAQVSVVSSVYTICAAAAKVQIVISTGFTTSTSVTGDVFLTGFYTT